MFVHVNNHSENYDIERPAVHAVLWFCPIFWAPFMLYISLLICCRVFFSHAARHARFDRATRWHGRIPPRKTTSGEWVERRVCWLMIFSYVRVAVIWSEAYEARISLVCAYDFFICSRCGTEARMKQELVSFVKAREEWSTAKSVLWMNMNCSLWAKSNTIITALWIATSGSFCVVEEFSLQLRPISRYSDGELKVNTLELRDFLQLWCR